MVSGEPALFYLRIANDDSLMLHQEWVAECVSRGLFLASHHNHFINAALSDEDIALSADIANDAFSVVAKRHRRLCAEKKVRPPAIPHGIARRFGKNDIRPRK